MNATSSSSSLPPTTETPTWLKEYATRYLGLKKAFAEHEAEATQKYDETLQQMHKLEQQILDRVRVSASAPTQQQWVQVNITDVADQKLWDQYCRNQHPFTTKSMTLATGGAPTSNEEEHLPCFLKLVSKSTPAPSNNSVAAHDRAIKRLSESPIEHRTLLLEHALRRLGYTSDINAIRKVDVPMPKKAGRKRDSSNLDSEDDVRIRQMLVSADDPHIPTTLRLLTEALSLAHFVCGGNDAKHESSTFELHLIRRAPLTKSVQPTRPTIKTLKDGLNYLNTIAQHDTDVANKKPLVGSVRKRQKTISSETETPTLNILHCIQAESNILTQYVHWFLRVQQYYYNQQRSNAKLKDALGKTYPNPDAPHQAPQSLESWMQTWVRASGTSNKPETTITLVRPSPVPMAVVATGPNGRPMSTSSATTTIGQPLHEQINLKIVKTKKFPAFNKLRLETLIAQSIHQSSTTTTGAQQLAYTITTPITSITTAEHWHQFAQLLGNEDFLQTYRERLLTNMLEYRNKNTTTTDVIKQKPVTALAAAAAATAGMRQPNL